MTEKDLRDFIKFLEKKGVKFEVTSFCGAKCYATTEYLERYVREFVSSKNCPYYEPKEVEE